MKSEFLMALATVVCCGCKITTEYSEDLGRLDTLASVIQKDQEYKRLEDDSNSFYLIDKLKEELYHGHLSDDEQQSLFLTELELLKIKGSPSYPTGITYGDTTDGQYSRCLASDTSSSEAQRNFGIEDLRLQSPGFDKLTFQINYHIVYSAVNAPEKEKLRDRLQKQTAILNTAFEQMDIRFLVASIDERTNPTWAENVYKLGDSYKSMTQTLSKNPETHINIYIVNLNNKFLGFSTFPWDEAVKKNVYFDGLVISPQSIVDGSDRKLTGMTLIHEMGHFFGLFHTFRDSKKKEDYCCRFADYNGCEGLGDEVPDTPPQRYCQFLDCEKCDVGESCLKRAKPGTTPCNTCTGDAFNDPLSNFMGYSPDNCMNTFTSRQQERMLQMIYRHRSKMILEQYLFSQ